MSDLITAQNIIQAKEGLNSCDFFTGVLDLT